MEQKIIIYDSKTCPFCIQAREAYGDRAVFVDVDDDQESLDKMLSLSGGKRQVPVMLSVCNICNRSRRWYDRELS